MADPTGKGARQQNAEQQAGHDGADGLPTPLVRHQVRRQRQRHMGYARKQPHQHTRRNHPRKAVRQGHEQQRYRYKPIQAHHQPASFRHIAQRHKAQQARRVPHLRRRRHHHHLLRVGVQGSSHHQQQRLVVVDRPYPDRTGQPQKGQQPALLGNGGTFQVVCTARGLNGTSHLCMDVILPCHDARWPKLRSFDQGPPAF